MVCSCSFVMPAPSVALLMAPMAAPVTPPMTGTKNNAPITTPQSAPQPAPCFLSSWPLLGPRMRLADRPADDRMVENLDEAVLFGVLEGANRLVRSLGIVEFPYGEGGH